MERKIHLPWNELRKGRFSEEGRAYHVTTVVADRRPVFRDLWLGRILVREMMRLQTEQAVESLAFVIMPDHLHWLMVLQSGWQLPQVMQRLKGRSARILAERTGFRPFWQRAYYDHAVRREEDLRAVARYVVANPMRGGIVKRLGDYSLWDAIWV
ncbi:MAG: transposase [Gammaproteobacteria bacterium]|nr:transposase [Gammaproteobacteria bacterium]